MISGVKASFWSARSLKETLRPKGVFGSVPGAICAVHRRNRMSATAVATGSRFYRATIGKKIVMAVTGLILTGFVIVHMAGNLGIVGGAEKFNHYAELLRTSMPLLWAARLVLLASVVLHIRAALQLYALKAAARPVAYAKKAHRGATFASRFMIWSGYALAAFIVYHILHFTTGTAHPEFIEGNVFHNVTSAFKNPAIAGIYIVSMGFLYLHLSHGLFSFTQSLGLSHPRYTRIAKVLATTLAVIIAAGFAAVPIAVLAAVVR
jgi:succinate dehydrogenase / fumarate reductase cytochrome b subunit